MPTNVHVDLLYNGIITNPFLGKQENDCQWVGETAWIYRGTFPTPDLGSRQKAVLAFDGLDTYATVVFNGIEILKTKDMFIPERVDITRFLEPEEENILEITFESTYLTGKKLVEQYPDHRWGCWYVYLRCHSSARGPKPSRKLSSKLPTKVAVSWAAKPTM